MFRVDPAKLPEGGVRARCAMCGNPFHVSAAAPEAAAPEEAVRERPAAPAMAEAAGPAVPVSVAEPAPAPTPAATAEMPPAAPTARVPTPFGQADPDARARRLARALVSDLVTYHPDLQERGLREGRLKELFWDEIKRSWQEYVQQVGLEMAQKTPHFRDALNEILSKGQKVF